MNLSLGAIEVTTLSTIKSFGGKRVVKLAFRGGHFTGYVMDAALTLHELEQVRHR